MAYDRFPSIDASAFGRARAGGWAGVRAALLPPADVARTVVVDAYPGVDLREIAEGLAPGLREPLVLLTTTLLLPQARLDAMLERFLTTDRVFGYLAPHTLPELLDEAALAAARAEAAAAIAAGRDVLVLGPGAAAVAEPDLLVYADLPRWELQKRQRAGARSWTADDSGADPLVKYKRGYFVEWRIVDRWKFTHFERVDHVLDTTIPGDPRTVPGPAMRAALAAVATRPFRLVPFFDSGVWGGQWLRRRFALPGDVPNYAWGFDGVPEENGLLLDFGGVTMEVPALNLVRRHPEALLGPRVHARFGPEFPIRFDFLDTMEGGNLSLQVHPDTGYAHESFGIPYTQDESYYILDAAPDACVYLGLRDGVTAEALFAALAEAGSGFDAGRYVNRVPVKAHDHLSIPAGTIHCAGAGCVVLEISATPYIFTFKLWDWGRVGLDGRPRPIHDAHGRAVLRAERDTAWVARELLGGPELLGDDGTVREERTGLHPLQFIETRRHRFTGPVAHDTGGSVNMLNLVEGEAVVVESPDGAFAPFPVGYAETFIVPAAVGAYTVRPLHAGVPHATIRASVRL